VRKLVLFAAMACSLYADSEVKGPSLGYVSSGAAVRNVLGIVGASQLSRPVLSDLQQAVVLPGTSVSVAVSPAGALIRVDLSDRSATELGVANVATITASPGGEMVLAVAGDRAHVFAKDGSRVGEFTLPGSPVLIAVADRGPAVAVTVAEPEGEALYLINEQGSRRLLQGPRLPALAFSPNSTDIVVSEDTGVISRFDGALQLRQVAVAPGAQALAVTPDHSRVLIVGGHSIRAVRLATGEETSVTCSCAAVMARPLGGPNFLLTRIEDGPIWIVDSSADELRVAFIPEAVNE
jgi:hypothetical protein